MIRTTCLAATAAVSLTFGAQAREYPVGGPVHKYDMEIVANYLVGVTMAPMDPGMPMGADVVHLESDVHATADNTHGFADGAWIPYLSIRYVLTKKDSPFHAEGSLLPMVAKDGAHYANDVRMNGAGTYTVTFTYASPETNGFRRHVDEETGVPAWWAPFSESFTFGYPARAGG